jgi:dynein heavy chain
MLDIAKVIKDKVDEFKPVVPLAVSLRKDGMKERHWDQLSEAVGFDIRPPPEGENKEGPDDKPVFTLTSVIDKGMLKFVEKADDIGEKAYKENHIEKSLAKMKLDWEPLNFMLPKFK